MRNEISSAAALVISTALLKTRTSFDSVIGI
jgi:hypothetical protein